MSEDVFMNPPKRSKKCKTCGFTFGSLQCCNVVNGAWELYCEAGAKAYEARRYVDRYKLLDALKRAEHEAAARCYDAREQEDPIDYKAIVQYEDTAKEVRPERYTEWVKSDRPDNPGYSMCEACKGFFFRPDLYPETQIQYCPNCGAKRRDLCE